MQGRKQKSPDPQNPQQVNGDIASSPQFEAVLTPYRSLSRAGFIALMAFVFFTCFLSGIGFLVIGGWPIFIFMMVDVLAIWLAFHLNYRSARAREEVAIWRDALRIRKIAPNGTATEYSFNPFWTRFSVDRHEHIGITRMEIVGQGRVLDIGGFLNPDDRESFARAFGSALLRARSS